MNIKKVAIDKGSGSLSYNRYEMQVSQTLHMAIELYDTLDYLLVLDYYDDITLFETDDNPEYVSYFQMKTSEDSISISTAISQDWLIKLYEHLEDPTWIVKELGLITNSPLKAVVETKDIDGKKKNKTEVYKSDKTSFMTFNDETINKIKTDIAKKKKINIEDVDLSKFVHMRTTLSISSHKEIVEKEMSDFLYKKYPRLTVDTVKTIYSTMMDLLTKRQQYENLSENASYEDVKKFKSLSKSDFSRVIDESIMISIPEFYEIDRIAKFSDELKADAALQYTQILSDSNTNSSSFTRVFKKIRELNYMVPLKKEENAWEYVNRICDLLYENDNKIQLIYNRLYICVLSLCIFINEIRRKKDE